MFTDIPTFTMALARHKAEATSSANGLKASALTSATPAKARGDYCGSGVEQQVDSTVETERSIEIGFCREDVADFDLGGFRGLFPCSVL